MVIVRYRIVLYRLCNLESGFKCEPSHARVFPMKVSDSTDASARPSPTETRILNAARELFFSEGFSAVSTEKLSKKAGVSKSSIYKYFSSMKGVLVAGGCQEGDILKVGVTMTPETKEDFWRSLIAYGTKLLTLLNQRHCIQFDQMLHEEARKYPDLSRSFYEVTYHRSHLEITQLIKAGKARGFITKPYRSEELADNLICMWESLAYTRARLSLIDKPFRNPKKWARQCVDALFENALSK